MSLELPATVRFTGVTHGTSHDWISKLVHRGFIKHRLRQPIQSLNSSARLDYTCCCRVCCFRLPSLPNHSDDNGFGNWGGQYQAVISKYAIYWYFEANHIVNVGLHGHTLVTEYSLSLRMVWLQDQDTGCWIEAKSIHKHWVVSKGQLPCMSRQESWFLSFTPCLYNIGWSPIECIMEVY